MGIFYAGLDLGQATDYTALAIIERIEKKGEPRIEKIEREYEPPRWGEWEIARELGLPIPHHTIVEEKVTQDVTVEYHLRHLERPQIGTPYPQIVRHVISLLGGQRDLRDAPLIIDRTGVGRAVYDLFWEAGHPGGVRGVTITAGDTVQTDYTNYRVPKRDLVAVMQTLLQEQRLKIANGLALGSVFAAEALNFKAKISLSGHDSYEAGAMAEWRDGAHDDLVLAVSLACWYAERPGVRIRFPIDGLIG